MFKRQADKYAYDPKLVEELKSVPGFMKQLAIKNIRRQPFF